MSLPVPEGLLDAAAADTATPIDALIARDIRIAGDTLEHSLNRMLDLFAELATALPNAVESDRLLRVVDMNRREVAAIVRSLRTHARKLER